MTETGAKLEHVLSSKFCGKDGAKRLLADENPCFGCHPSCGSEIASLSCTAEVSKGGAKEAQDRRVVALGSCQEGALSLWLCPSRSDLARIGTTCRRP